MARPRIASRPARWRAAVDDARSAHSAAEAALEDLTSALHVLADIQSEYQDWYDNLPEGLNQSATADRLQEVIDIDLDLSTDTTTLNEFGEAIDAAEGVELPLGWGKD